MDLPVSTMEKCGKSKELSDCRRCEGNYLLRLDTGKKKCE